MKESIQESMKHTIEQQPGRDARRRLSAVRRLSLLLAGAALIAAAGCGKDDLYNTPHPDKGALVVTANWSARSSDAVLPESYTLCIGEREQAVSGETNVFTDLLLPGSHDLLIRHEAEGMTVGGSLAVVDTLANGTLEPMPGYLFSAACRLPVVPDDTLRVTVPLQQHTRRLKLALKLNPGDDERLRGVSATLTGIASAVDLATGAIASANGKVVVPAFVLVPDGGTRATGNPMLVATLRLLGVVPHERQVLSLAIRLTDGSVQTIDTDLSGALRDFAAGSDREPLTLDAALTLPAEAGFTATIGDWHTVDNGDIDIN